MVLRQPSTDSLRRQLVMVGEPDHLIGQELEGRAGPSRAGFEQAVASKSATSLLDSLLRPPDGDDLGKSRPHLTDAQPEASNFWFLRKRFRFCAKKPVLFSAERY